MKEKNLLFIVPVLSGGGAEKVVSQLASVFANKYNVYIAVEKRVDDEYYVSDRVRILCLKDYSDNSVIALKKIKKANNIDVSFAFSSKSIMNNVLSKNKEKQIASIRSIMTRGFSKRKALMTSFFANRSDEIIAVCQSTCDAQIKYFNAKPDRISVIQNPIDNAKIAELSEGELDNQEVEKLIADRKKIIIVHGRLATEKGHGCLIRVMRLVLDRIPDVHLLILGQGPRLEETVSLIEKLGIKENIHLLGFQPNPYVYLKIADLYAFSSLFEGFPNALLDAIAVGLPVISTDGMHAARELLAPDTAFDAYTQSVDYAKYGVLVKNFERSTYDADAPYTDGEKFFAEAIIRMLTDDELREAYSKKALDRSKDFYLTDIAKQWEQHFN